MDYRHREVIKKYSYYLQQSINLCNMKMSLKNSKLFTEYMLKDIYDGNASFFEELPTRGPEAFFRFIDLLKTNGHSEIAEELCHVTNPDYQISKQHGYSFILSNDGFEGILNSEECIDLKSGCEMDSYALDSALSSVQCGYKNHSNKTNLSANQLKLLLKEFSEMDFSNVNSCIIIILGLIVKKHDSKVIYDKEGNYIFLHDIVNLFSDINCPTLKYKPKIFLLSSVDNSHNYCVENFKILPNVNDTFLWYFPSFRSYKHVKKKDCKFFGEILSEILTVNYLKSDFETIFNSSYNNFMDQFKKDLSIPQEDLNIMKCEKLGNCREKIFFTLMS